MGCHLQNAIAIIDDILSKVDDFAKLTPEPADASVQPAGEAAATKKQGKKKDKKAKNEAAAPAPAAINEQSSDPFTMADLRVCARCVSW
jgi:hypothetical protein